MNDQILISIIVPIYNADKYLLTCIESILNQTYRRFELLLINDGSSDNSMNICELYLEKDQRVKLFHNNNSGVSSARNLGLHYAEGDWITCVDADEWIDSNALESYLSC